MSDERHVDGNAVGGILQDIFGREMTHQRGCCGTCGTVAALGSVHVHRGPGDVLRCTICGSVIMVIVSSEAGVRIHFESLLWMDLGDNSTA